MTLAQRLGYKPTDKVLILHADDVGESPGVNKAVITALETGRIQSCSVMVDKYSEPFLQYMKGKHYDIGLHFCSSTLGTRLATLQIESQYKHLVSRGVLPTHVDSHGGTVYLHPSLGKVFMAFSKAKRIPALIPTSTVENDMKFTALGAKVDVFRDYNGIRVDDLIILSYLGGCTYKLKSNSFLSVLNSIRPGITQIILHISSNYNEHQKWYWENMLLSDKRIQNKLNEFKFINWRQISERYSFI